jgi:hypothetical protein
MVDVDTGDVSPDWRITEKEIRLTLAGHGHK